MPPTKDKSPAIRIGSTKHTITSNTAIEADLTTGLTFVLY